MKDLASLRNDRKYGWRVKAPQLAFALLTGGAATSACLSDVEVPLCVRENFPCTSEAGSPNDADNTAGTPSGSTGNAGGGVPGDSGAGAMGQTAGNASAVAGDGGSEAVGGVASAGEAGAAGRRDAPVCPNCVILPEQLAAPCAHEPYIASLTIQGGTPKYAWEIKPQVDGWTIATNALDPEGAILKSEAPNAGTTTLSITVTGSDGLVESQTYVVQARESCWLAYTSLEQGAPALQLLDPLVIPPAPLPLENNSGVYDFSFSPDGRYLAYRFGATDEFPHGRHLALLDLSSLQEQRLDFDEDAVTAFAWSPNAAVLAAAFGIGAGGYLGAVAMPEPGSGFATASLTSVPAVVQSELTWIGNDHVAYLSELMPDSTENPERLLTPYAAKLGATGFSTPIPRGVSLAPPRSLLPTTQGVYTLGQPFLATWARVGDAPAFETFHGDSSLIAGSGDYSVMVDGDGALQVLSAEVGDQGDPVAISASSDTCSLVLAWASGLERIACVRDFDDATADLAHGEIRFFDLLQGAGSLSMIPLPGACEAAATCAPRGYRYDSTQAYGQARGFSRSGRWFAFTSVVNGFRRLRWSDLASQPFTVFDRDDILSDGPSWVSFSPSDDLLAARLGSKLTLVDLTRPAQSDVLSYTLADASDCSEDFMAEPGRYCGSAPQATDAAWGAESLTIAFRSAAQVIVVDTSHLIDSMPAFALPAPACDGRCSGQLAFQPRLNH